MYRAILYSFVIETSISGADARSLSPLDGFEKAEATHLLNRLSVSEVGH